MSFRTVRRQGKANEKTDEKANQKEWNHAAAGSDRGRCRVLGVALGRKHIAQRRPEIDVVRHHRLCVGRPACHPGQRCRRGTPNDAQDSRVATAPYR